MAGVSFDRLLVCLPARPPLDGLLEEAARLASALGVWTVEVVAAPEHDLHASRRGLIAGHLGQRAGDIHFVPSADLAARLAARLADPRTLIVIGPKEARRLPRRIASAVLVLPSGLRGRSVVAVVDPERDTPVVVTTALAMAATLGLFRVLACYPWFDESAVTTDAVEARAVAARQERLSIFLARVPPSDLALEPRVVFAPHPGRALARVAREERAALLVSAARLQAEAGLLVLPSEVACRPRPPSTLAALWHAFLDEGRFA